MHLDGGVAADGTRVLSEASVAAMQEKQVALPRLTGMGDAWGLGWEILVDGDPTVIGHDGGTIGQSAFLRVVPEAGLVVAMLTNGGDVMGLFDDVVKPIVKDVAGVSLHGFPKPPAEAFAIDPAPMVGLLLQLDLRHDRQRRRRRCASGSTAPPRGSWPRWARSPSTCSSSGSGRTR